MKMNVKNLWKTNKIFRIASIAFAAILLISGSFLIYQTFNKKPQPSSKNTSEPTEQNNPTAGNAVTGVNELDLSSPPENSMAYFLSQNGTKYINPDLGPTGRKIIQPEPGEAGTWDIPIPLINPLGSQKLYSDTKHFDSKGQKIQYISNYTEYNKTISGEYWFLPVNNGSGLPIQYIKDYAASIGAEIFSSVYDDRLIFRLYKDDALWWCDAKENNGGYEFVIIKQNIFKTGKEYTISEDTAEYGQIVFCTENNGGKFQTVYVTIPSGKLRLRAESNIAYGNSNTKYRYSVNLDSQVSNTYILDNLPQFEGVYDWYIDPSNDNVTSSLTFRIEEGYDIPKIKAGKELGSLLVKGAPSGSVYVLPQNFTEIEFSESNQSTTYGNQETKGTLTPEGDTIFTLPSGFWTVIYTAPYMRSGSTRTQLVPVNSGEQTIVSLPESLKSADARLNGMADDSELTGGVEITESKDLNTTAEISISVSDPLDRDINPTKENTIIYEGSSKVNVTDIKRVVAPCSVALVIDSSGSMKSDMQGTINAAKSFLETLPAGSFVQVIDFDTKVKVLKGETPADAIKALSEISSGGYTKLYDATLKGLETVIGKTRPAVVVFTDGRDSSHDNTGGGSTSSKELVIAKIKEAKIPVYTIGYGKRLNEEEAQSAAQTDGVPDIQCLLEFASAANGQYYPAKNPEALPGVFAAISSKLGNNFVITYNRPTEHNISETPFVSIVVDNSGSMNLAPRKEDDCGFRMEKTIGLFHNFLEKLPSDVMMQLTTFQAPSDNTIIIQQQTTTDQKANILKALGEMDARGGTPVIEALRSAYENIIPVPSSKKVIVFLTDGGLAVPKSQVQQYNDLLAKIKEKNISILFIGMSTNPVEQVFADAAKATGGDYVIGEDMAAIQTKLNQLLNTLKQTTATDTIPLSISIKWNTSEGELSYAVSDEVEFSLPQKAGPPIEPDMVETKTGIPYKRYDTIQAANVTGLGISGIENIVTGNIPLNEKLSNNAMELTVKNATYLSVFQGVNAKKAGKQFIALEVVLENKTKDKIPYKIPSLFKHFYIGVNQQGQYPASKATWLSAKPLALHGNPAIRIEPGEKKSGVIVFVVPSSKEISQLSLHFYDTSYGHIQLPLAGKLSDKWLEVDKLPTSAPASLSDTFTMELTGKSFQPKIEQYQANELSSFKIIEASFESKVQALLNLNPKDRFWLKLDTKSGSLMTKMSDVTAALPFGFLEPVMLGPASDNTVRMAYELPYQMDKYKSDIFVDLTSGAKELTVNSGETYGAPSPVTTLDGPGIKVTVNQLVAVDKTISVLTNDQKTRDILANSVILDVTFTDIPGNEGTRIPADFFTLVNKNYQASSGNVTAGRIGLDGADSSGSKLISPNNSTKQLIFGVNSSFGVFEGQSRRGIVIFNKPNGAIEDWTLQSRYMEGIQVPVTKGSFASPELLGYKTDIEVNNDFETQLKVAIQSSVDRYAALNKETSNITNISLSDEDGLQNVPMPSISTYGLKQLDLISNESQVIWTLQSLRCLPLNRNEGALLTYGYQPEAVLTQGWGEIGDLTNLALKLLSKLGYSPEVRTLALTEAGKKVLTDFSGVTAKETTPLGISYRNGNGENRMLVIPFMMDLSELNGLVYYQTVAENIKYSNQKATIEVYIKYEPGVISGTAAGSMGDMAGVLGGGDGNSSEKRLQMLNAEITLDELSTDALDLCFMPTSGVGGLKNYCALLSTPKGMITGQTILQNPEKVLGIELVVKNISGNKNLVHYTTLGEGDSLDKFFQTIAINLPDLTEGAAAALDETARQVHDSANNPDPISIAKWYGRNIIHQFISGSSMLDNQIASGSGIVLGRVSQPRCLVVTSHLDDSENMHTTMDLLQPWNQIHAGSDDAKKAYNLMSGFYLSDLEGEVLPGENKVSYLDLWQQAPSGTTIQTIPVMDNNRNEILAQMETQKKYPFLLLNAVKENKKLIFAPTEPTVFMGQERWAWLEIDPDTYKVISVFDTGMHAGMAEFKLLLLPTEDDTMKWMKGIWVGTNVSVWTMCSSDLKYGDNYKAALADAKNTAYQVADTVSKFFDIAESIQGKEIGFEIDLPGGAHKIDLKISMSGIKGSIAQKMYSYSGGMKLAIDAYFGSIVPQPETPGKPKTPKEYEPE